MSWFLADQENLHYVVALHIYIDTFQNLKYFFANYCATDVVHVGSASKHSSVIFRWYGSTLVRSLHPCYY